MGEEPARQHMISANFREEHRPDAIGVCFILTELDLVVDIRLTIDDYEEDGDYSRSRSELQKQNSTMRMRQIWVALDVDCGDS